LIVGLETISDLPIEGTKGHLRVRQGSDTAAATTDFVIDGLVHARAVPVAISRRRRRISPEAGRALEILGHAIEYLADEYVHSVGTFSASDPEVEAIQLLMALNRQIYFECPAVPTWGERLRACFRADSR
jgi:hypothetical protein